MLWDCSETIFGSKQRSDDKCLHWHDHLLSCPLHRMARTSFSFPIDTWRWGLSGRFTTISLVSTRGGTLPAKTHAICLWSLHGHLLSRPIKIKNWASWNRICNTAVGWVVWWLFVFCYPLVLTWGNFTWPPGQNGTGCVLLILTEVILLVVWVFSIASFATWTHSIHKTSYGKWSVQESKQASKQTYTRTYALQSC